MFQFKQRVLTHIGIAAFVLATVGTGFGQWFFSQGDTEKLLNPSIDLATAMDFTGFTTSLNGTLKMDASGSTFSTCSLDVVTTVNVIKGLIGEETTDENGESVYSVSSVKNIQSISLAYDVTCTFNSTVLHSYIYCQTIGGVTVSNNKATVNYTLTDTSGSGIEGNTTLSASFPIVFAWQDNMKPETDSAVSTMSSKLSSLPNNAVTFQVSFNASDENSKITYYA